MSHRFSIYWNTHRRCFSIKPGAPGFEPSPRGRVFYNTGPFLVEEPLFVVSEAGRQWVLRNRKKTVHAVIRGEPKVPKHFFIPPGARRVRYNPYKNETFVFDDGTPVYSANRAYLKDKEVWVT